MTAVAHKNYGTYFPETVLTWKKLAEKSRFRDYEFMQSLLPYFKKGTTLELGGAVGQFVEILQDLDYDCLGSDYFDFFVEYQTKRGLSAIKIDATDIQAHTDRKFANIFAQALSPLQSKDGTNHDMVRKTYRSIWNALEPEGRLIICQTDYKHSKEKQKKYLNYTEQLEIIKQDAIFEVVKVIPHQIVPSGFYSFYNKKILNWIDFKIGALFPFRHVLVLEKTK